MLKVYTTEAEKENQQEERKVEKRDEQIEDKN
jgi:hypothetical protein